MSFRARAYSSTQGGRKLWVLWLMVFNGRPSISTSFVVAVRSGQAILKTATKDDARQAIPKPTARGQVKKSKTVTMQYRFEVHSRFLILQLNSEFGTRLLVVLEALTRLLGFWIGPKSQTLIRILYIDRLPLPLKEVYSSPRSPEKVCLTIGSDSRGGPTQYSLIEGHVWR